MAQEIEYDTAKHEAEFRKLYGEACIRVVCKKHDTRSLKQRLMFSSALSSSW